MAGKAAIKIVKRLLFGCLAAMRLPIRPRWHAGGGVFLGANSLALGIEWVPKKTKGMIHGALEWTPIVFHIIHETNCSIEWE